MAWRDLDLLTLRDLGRLMQMAGTLAESKLKIPSSLADVPPFSVDLFARFDLFDMTLLLGHHVLKHKRRELVSHILTLFAPKEEDDQCVYSWDRFDIEASKEQLQQYGRDLATSCDELNNHLFAEWQAEDIVGGEGDSQYS